MDGSSNQDSEHMHNWLRKLKESQERRRDEKIRRYNDVVSKLIILLIGVCIVCVIIIAALVVQNESMRKSYNELILINQTNYDSQQRLINSVTNQSNDRISLLENKNRVYEDFILSNRTIEMNQTISIDPSSPKVKNIHVNNTYYTIEFIDGSVDTKPITSYTFYLG